MTYDEAFALLRKYNSEPFHITHALTVSCIMRRMANELGYGDEADFWAIVGALVLLQEENPGLAPPVKTPS